MSKYLSPTMDSLFSDDFEITEDNPTKTDPRGRGLPFKVEWIPVESLVVNPFNARGRTTDKALKNLMRSIAQFGVLMPIIVVRDPRTGEIITSADGNRRMTSAKKLGLTHVPGLVFEPGLGQTVQDLIDLLWTEHNSTVRSVSGAERVESACRGAPIYTKLTEDTKEILDSIFSESEQIAHVDMGFSFAPDLVEKMRKIIREYFGFSKPTGSYPEDYSDPAVRALARSSLRWMCRYRKHGEVRKFLEHRAKAPSEYKIKNLVQTIVMDVDGVPGITAGFTTPRLVKGVELPRMRRR